jgi:heme-degrading monooxygenase HmoA
MYARLDNIKLKKDAAEEFAKIFETQVIPILSKQEGFRHALNLVTRDRTEVTGISFWTKRQNAENYNNTDYAEVLKSLSNVIDGTPEVKNFIVASSTLRKNQAVQPI